MQIVGIETKTDLVIEDNGIILRLDFMPLFSTASTSVLTITHSSTMGYKYVVVFDNLKTAFRVFRGQTNKI